MPRDLPLPLGAVLADRVVRPFFYIHVDFPDPVYAWTGTGTLLLNDAQWTGIHGVASIDTVDEGSDGSATGIRATLYRIPSEFRDDIADQAVRGCPMELGVGALDETFQQVVGTRLLRRAVLDKYEVTDSGTELTVSISGEGRAIDQRRPAIKRYTDEYQQRKFDGDRFFEYVPKMVSIPILWAKAEQKVTASGGGLGGGFNGYSHRNVF